MDAGQLLGWMVLAAAVQALGLFVAGVARVRAELVSARRTAARLAPRALRVIRKVAENADASVCSFHLAPPDGTALPAFKPGQFITIRAASPDAADLQRCYSLSNAPGEAFYRISVKRVADGRMSNWLHSRLGEGDMVLANAPAGGFHLNESDTPVVLVSGGIGITPMLAMLEHLHATGSARDVHFLHGCRNGRDFAFATRLRALQDRHRPLRLRRWFSDPGVDDLPGRDYDHSGRIDVQALLDHLPAAPFDVFICGPGAMMQDLVAGLRAAGIAEQHIHFEAFGPASVPRAEGSGSPADGDTAAVPVNFARSGKQATSRPGITLLELAEAAGVGIPTACRSGSCGTCQTPIVSGTVSYIEPPTYPPEAGTCLPCVCRPASELVLDA